MSQSVSDTTYTRTIGAVGRTRPRSERWQMLDLQQSWTPGGQEGAGETERRTHTAATLATH